jgi:Clp amino terminal domain, pathogenicity island component
MACAAPNPAYYRTLGRADEIARMLHSPHVRAEHQFLAILHDDKHWTAAVLARMVDLNLVEAAVTEKAGNPADQQRGRPPGPDQSGFRVAAEMDASYVGREHLFLALIRDRQSVPARALASLIDLDQVEDAVLDTMNSPGFRGFKNSFGGDELLLPEGQELDPALITAIAKSVPAGATFGFNWREEDGRPWIRVTQPGNPRNAVNTALADLGRPPLR